MERDSRKRLCVGTNAWVPCTRFFSFNACSPMRSKLFCLFKEPKAQSGEVACSKLHSQEIEEHGFELRFALFQRFSTLSHWKGIYPDENS